MVKDLSMTPASQWYTLSGEKKQMYPSTWIQQIAPCCRHCVWSLGYPLFNPILISSDRTSNQNANYLDCTQFQVLYCVARAAKVLYLYRTCNCVLNCESALCVYICVFSSGILQIQRFLKSIFCNFEYLWKINWTGSSLRNNWNNWTGNSPQNFFRRNSMHLITTTMRSWHTRRPFHI